MGLGSSEESDGQQWVVQRPSRSLERLFRPRQLEHLLTGTNANSRTRPEAGAQPSRDSRCQCPVSGYSGRKRALSPREIRAVSARSRGTADVACHLFVATKSPMRSFNYVSCRQASSACRTPVVREGERMRPTQTARSPLGRQILNASTAATAGVPAGNSRIAPRQAHQDEPCRGGKVGDTQRPTTAHARASTPGCPAGLRPRQYRPRCRR
jgi:hypothetical protein